MYFLSLQASWLVDSLHAGTLLPLSYKHMIFTTEHTKFKLAEEADQYGDSYTEKLTCDVFWFANF